MARGRQHSLLPAWNGFQLTVNRWFHRPDFLALRACLATARALDLNTGPVWMMLIGPSSCGKSELYLNSLDCYPRLERTSDINIPALISMENGKQGNGLLKRLSPTGLWVINDFSSILSGREETRNQVTAACREIFDGRYQRAGRGENQVWEGKINVVAACTPAIDHYYRVHADLGERFLQIQIDRLDSCVELRRKAGKQRNNLTKFHKEIQVASAQLFNGSTDIELPEEMDEAISRWAEFTSLTRRVVSRNSYSGEISSLGYAEGSGRLYGEMCSLAMGDASIMGLDAVEQCQVDLIGRVALDSLTRIRRAIIGTFFEFPIGEEIRRADLQELSGISHPQTFTRALEDLEAIEVLEKREEGPNYTYFRTSTTLSKVLRPLFATKV
jgi:hypothetical protein